MAHMGSVLSSLPPALPHMLQLLLSSPPAHSSLFSRGKHLSSCVGHDQPDAMQPSRYKFAAFGDSEPAVAEPGRVRGAMSCA